MLCILKNNLYLSHVSIWLSSKNISFALSWMVNIFLPKAMLIHSVQRQGISGSYSVTSVVLSPQTKNSDKESYVRRKIQALTIRVVNLVRHIILKSQIHTLTQWGRLEFVCKDRPFLLFFNMLYPRYDAKEPDMFNR